MHWMIRSTEYAEPVTACDPATLGVFAESLPSAGVVLVVFDPLEGDRVSVYVQSTVKLHVPLHYPLAFSLVLALTLQSPTSSSAKVDGSWYFVLDYAMAALPATLALVSDI